MSTFVDTKRLRAEMVLNDVSVDQLAKDIGICTSALYRKLNGKSEYTRAEMDAISKRLKLEKPADIFFADKVSQKTQAR